MKELGRQEEEKQERKEVKEEIKDKGVRGKRKEQKAWSRDKKMLENRVSPSFYQIIGRIFQRPHKILGYKVPGSAHLDLYLRGVWARSDSKGHRSSEAFKSGTGHRSLRFSKRHPSGELGGVGDDPVPMSEAEKTDPRVCNP